MPLQSLLKRWVLVVQMTPEMQAEMGVPDMVQHYHSLYPLEDLRLAEEGVSRGLGVQSSVLKAISAQDGQAYALRKLSWRQVTPGCTSPHAAHTLPHCMGSGHVFRERRTSHVLRLSQ